MEILIEKNVKLVSDKDGWKLLVYRPLTKGPRAGQPDWAEDGHFDTLQWALVGAWKTLLAAGRGKADLAALARRVEAVEKRLLELGKSAMDLALGDAGGGPHDPWQPA